MGVVGSILLDCSNGELLFENRKNTNKIRIPLFNVNMDFESVVDKTLNDYLPKYSHLSNYR